MGFLTRLLAGLLAASTLGTGLAGTANAVDAAGAASDATGAVTTTADDTGGRTVLDCRQSGEGATGPYADKFCWIDWSNLPLDSSGKPTPVRINVPGGHIDADATVTHTDNAALTAKDFTGNKWSRLTPAYRLTGNTALAFHHIQGNSADPLASVMFSNITSVANQTATSVNVLKDFQLAFGDAETMSGYVVNDKKTYEQTDIESDKMLDKLGMIGDANPNQSYSEANTGYGTTHVTLAGGPAGKHAPFTDDSNSKGAAVIGATQPTRFKVSFKQVNHPVNNAWSAIAIGVYMPYLTAYPLTYDKNSSDASGQVPSNQRGKENTTQPAKTKTSGIVKTVADDTSNLPDHLVNGDFNVNYKDQWLTGGWNWTSITPDGKYLNSVRNWNDSATTWKTVNGWDKTKFGWSSTQKDGTDDIQHKAGAVEIQYDDQADNVYAELCAYEAGTAIYQDIKTVPGTLYKVRLKHASLYDGYLDKMQVMIGAPGHEQPVEMTRTGVNGHGDKLNEKSNIIATKVSNTGENDRNHDSQWESYEGTYLIPAGQTVTRFTFRSVGSRNLDHGNLLDDIVFDKAYRLDYDKNSTAAAGEVPSNQRGKENTVQPAKSKTTGTVKTVVDTSDGLPTELVNGDFEYPGADVLSQNLRDKKRNWWGVSRKDKMVYESDNPTKWVSLPSTFDSDRFAWDSSEAGKTSGVQEGSSQWHTNEVELQRDSRTGNMYAELSPYQAQSSIRQYIRTTPGALYKVRLKHASLSSEYLDKMQVLIGADGNEQPVRMTRVESQNGLDAIGESTASTTISTHASNKAEISWGSGLGYHSSRNHDGQWATYEGVYVATSDVTVFTFKSVDSPSFNTGNLLDDVVFTKAYKLTYDKNSADASGQVPSNQRGKENTTQPAKSKASGTVKTVADDTSNLPDHLVNGDFSVNYHDQWKDSFGGWTSIDPNAGKTLHATNYVDSSGTWKWTAINGWDRSKFGWTSTQKAGSNVQQKANAVELQYDDSTADNVYAELCAYEAGTAIYQDIRTVPGTLYKVRLKHASLNSTYLDKMQVMIGAPGHEQPVEMTRTSVNGHGDKLNEKSTTIATKVTNGNNRHHADQWETYEGTYLIPDGQTTTRFTFKSIDSKQLDYGNVLDDIVFDKAYRLDYDKNASDATGEVPSNQRGRENTTQPAKDKTSGSVKLVADDDVVEYAANGLPKQIVNSDFDHDWRNIVSQSKMSAKYNFANIDPAHGDVEISGALNSKGEASKHWVHLNGFDANKFGWKSNQTDTRVDGRGGIVEIQRSKANDNMYAEITASQANTYLYQDIDTAHDYPTVYTVKLRYAHRNGTINSNEKIQILVGAPGHEQPVEMTRIASDRGNRLGEKSTTVNAPNTDGWLGSWDTFQGSVVVPAGRNVSRFTFKALGSIDGISGNLIDDVQFKLAYKLSYDKNSQDASGQVPSNTTPDTTQTASSKSTGKVSDLVQRTTTHEDGSVTVKTIDTSTDVVSGCQVYYPAGQKITLATMAKDDDCWDSSMLSRPGHTQLGWNQDRNATQAQAQVTMVEGGMTVYAVWVGNPVLTYDTNKPSTWTGEMPSTPASVSVPYNTAAADGSGWQAGDVSKLRGYKFLGWYTGPQDNAGLYDWNTLLTGSVTVYAHWQRLQANVIYNANGGTGSHANTTGWQYSDVTIPGDTSKSFTRDGYVFKGWSLKAGKADVVYKDGSQIPLQDKDITLYAQWQGIHENFTETGGISLPLLIAGGIGLLVMGVGSTVMLTRRMNGHGMPDGE
ncbi:InlB B-repeat-containing protein [Bifidobacterium adolescentis]|uniref:InlB B-repeat-containing protein n=2 Tax=Bacillati TaxID=1783272 RepID=UPI0022E77BCA|nr:InlB B-repeat-containing protein [Bifidobacterium adolescentis]